MSQSKSTPNPLIGYSFKHKGIPMRFKTKIQGNKTLGRFWRNGEIFSTRRYTKEGLLYRIARIEKLSKSGIIKDLKYEP